MRKILGLFILGTLSVSAIAQTDAKAKAILDKVEGQCTN